MPLMDDIAAAQKNFESAIAQAEQRKKDIDGYEAAWGNKGNDFSKEVQRVVVALKEAKEQLANWSIGYDIWIASLKEYTKDFASYKKKSVDAEKFYNTLKDEKVERDKQRKKLGAGSKPTKEDEIADGAFKKAQTAYENDPGRAVESLLKDIAVTAKSMEAQHRILSSDLDKAATEYDKLCKELRGFVDSTAVSRWDKNYKAEKNPLGADFDGYFKKFG